MPEEVSPTEQVSPEEEEVSEEETLPEKVPQIFIGETETGWLRVREKPGTVYPEIAKVYPTESYPLLEETPGWYKIELDDRGEGWVFAKYASKSE